MKELYLILIHTMKKKIETVAAVAGSYFAIEGARCDSERTGRKSASGGYVHRGAERLSIPSLIKTNKCWKILHWAWKPTWATLQKA